MIIQAGWPMARASIMALALIIGLLSRLSQTLTSIAPPFVTGSA